MVKIKTNKKIIVSIFIVTLIYIILGIFGNKVFATTPGTLTSNINEVDEAKYPGYKNLINDCVYCTVPAHGVRVFRGKLKKIR